ncbi:MAG: ribbon-helix-helix domain-containing protein [Candidatus Altiarchaeales archaeon]|nr:ribbon-helix-helix domain-containing protein [Candidatus Altiarchaeales archaeon]
MCVHDTYVFYTIKDEEVKRVSFHLTDNEIKALKAVREKTGYTQAELIRKAVDLLLNSWCEKPGVTGIINLGGFSSPASSVSAEEVA